jgi:hypothetical protein
MERARRMGGEKNGKETMIERVVEASGARSAREEFPSLALRARATIRIKRRG